MSVSVRPAPPPPARPRHGTPSLASVAVAFFLVAHGAVHAMGVALLWKLGEPGQLRYADAVPTAGTVAGYAVGVGWLLAGVLLVVAAVQLLTGRGRWRISALAGALLSAVVIGLSPGQAVAGLVADALILLLVLGSWMRERRRAALRG